MSRKLISADGKKAWTLLKLRAFPAEEEWKKTGNVASDIITGEEVSRIITKDKYASLHPLAALQMNAQTGRDIVLCVKNRPDGDTRYAHNSEVWIKLKYCF